MTGAQCGTSEVGGDPRTRPSGHVPRARWGSAHDCADVMWRVDVVGIRARGGGDSRTAVGRHPGSHVACAAVSAVVPVRQRALLPAAGGAVEGWIDDDVATAATQLFGGSAGLLTIDHHDVLRSTARVVGSKWGDVHLKLFMAIITLHVNHGMPQDGVSYTSAAELASIIWGYGTRSDGTVRRKGGAETKDLLRALSDLRSARFVFRGRGLRGEDAAVTTDVDFLANLMLDDTLLRAFQAPGATGLSQADFGRAFGKRQGRGTIGWRLDPLYVRRLSDAELRRFDLLKAQQLRGAALAMWLLFSSPRIPYRSLFGAHRSGLVSVDVPLTEAHCHELGVKNAQAAGRRRTINQAGERICAADRSFVSFEAHGGRGQSEFLRIVRRDVTTDALERPYGAADQLMLDPAA